MLVTTIKDTNNEIFILNKKDINDNTFEKFIRNKLKEVIKEKKENLYDFKNSDNKNSETIATNNNGGMQMKYTDGTAVIIGNSILNGIIQERLSWKVCIVKAHNFRGATIDDIK